MKKGFKAPKNAFFTQTEHCWIAIERKVQSKAHDNKAPKK